MGSVRLSKPFLEAWMKRTRKQLSGSGRISELALILARDAPRFTHDEWRLKLQAIYQGDEEPNLEFLTQIDSLLAKPSGKIFADQVDTLLFD
jgi:hypothetical protein